MADPFIAEIILFAGTFPPRGYAFCEGQLLQIAQNTALFSLIGTTYGGDGRTTFALPDLRSRAPMHWGNGPGLGSYAIGERVGTETEFVTAARMPSHSHVVAPPCSNTSSNGGAPGGNYPGKDLAGANGTYSKGQTGTMAPFSTDVAGGGGPAVDHRQPYLAISYCIALIGTFPSRN